MSAWATQSVSGQPGLHETETKPQMKRKKHLAEEKVTLRCKPSPSSNQADLSPVGNRARGLSGPVRGALTPQPRP